MFADDAWVLDAAQDEDITAVEPARGAEMIPGLVGLLQASIMQITAITEVLSGQQGSREIAAWAIRLSADLAREMYEPISANLTRHGVSIGSRMLSAVRAFDETIEIASRKGTAGKSIKITPEDAEGWRVLVTAAMEPRFLVTRNADLGLLDQLWANKTMPWTWLIQRLAREDNPEELRREKRLDRWQESPVVDDFYTRQAVKEAEIVLSDDEGMDVEELQGLFGELSPQMKKTLTQGGALPPGGAGGGGGTSGAGGALPAEATIQSIRKTGQATNEITGIKPTQERR